MKKKSWMLWPAPRILLSGTGWFSTSACFSKVMSMKTSWLFSAPPNVYQKVLQWSYYSFWFPCLGICFQRARAFLLRSTGKGGGAGGTLGLRPILPSRSPAPPPRWAHPAASSQLPEGIWDFHGNRAKTDLTSPWKIASEHPRLPSLILLRCELMSSNTVIHCLMDCLSATSAQCFLHHHFLRSFPIYSYPRDRKLVFGILLPGAR